MDVRRGVVERVVDALELCVEVVTVAAGPERGVATQIVQQVIVAHYWLCWLLGTQCAETKIGVLEINLATGYFAAVVTRYRSRCQQRA